MLEGERERGREGERGILVATQSVTVILMLNVLDLGIIEWGILGVPLNEHGYQTCGSIGGGRGG